MLELQRQRSISTDHVMKSVSFEEQNDESSTSGNEGLWKIVFSRGEFSVSTLSHVFSLESVC